MIPDLLLVTPSLRGRVNYPKQFIHEIDRLTVHSNVLEIILDEIWRNRSKDADYIETFLELLLSHKIDLQNFKQQIVDLCLLIDHANMKVLGFKLNYSILLNLMELLFRIEPQEFTKLIEFQNAFEAAARLISVVDEMAQTVINMI